MCLMTEDASDTNLHCHMLILCKQHILNLQTHSLSNFVLKLLEVGTLCIFAIMKKDLQMSIKRVACQYKHLKIACWKAVQIKEWGYHWNRGLFYRFQQIIILKCQKLEYRWTNVSGWKIIMLRNKLNNFKNLHFLS